MTFTKQYLRKILRTNSPDTIVNGKPLLFWTLDKPKLVHLLLDTDANPNIDFEIEPGISVTPLFVTKLFIEKLNRLRRLYSSLTHLDCMTKIDRTIHHLRETRRMLTTCGGHATAYRKYIRLDIGPKK